LTDFKCLNLSEYSISLRILYNTFPSIVMDTSGEGGRKNSPFVLRRRRGKLMMCAVAGVVHKYRRLREGGRDMKAVICKRRLEAKDPKSGGADSKE